MRVRRNLGVILLAIIVCLLGGIAAFLLTNWAGHTRTVFLGNGAIALQFSLAPALVAAVWVALSLWHSGKGWVWASVAVFVLGFVVAMVVHFLPLLAAVEGMDPNLVGFAYLTVAPLLAAGLGFGLSARYVGLTRLSVAVAVGLVLLGAAGLEVGSWIAVPFVMLLAVALPLVATSAAKRGPGRARSLWLVLGLLSSPLAFVAGIQLGYSLSKLLK